MRKRSFKQRKIGFLKKLNDFKILCDVDACAVIYNPFNSNPDVWPSKPEMNDVIKKLKILMERKKKCQSVNHEEFLNLYISKTEKQNKRLIEDNKKTIKKEVMFKCLDGNMRDLDMNDNDRLDLCKFIDQYLNDLYHHIKVTLNNPNFEIGESSSMDMTQTATSINMPTTVVDVDMAPPTMAEVSSSSFLNTALTFNSHQLNNEVEFTVSPNHDGIEHVESFTSNFLSNDDQNTYIQAMNQFIMPSNQGPEQVDFLLNSNKENFIPIMDQSVIPSNKESEEFNILPSSNQEVYIPFMNQDECYYPIQNLCGNQQQRFIEEMMNYAEQTNFPWMVNDHF